MADVEAVLDHLGWDRALVVGHSWGGHLALHVALALPHRLLGVLAVDPLGGVGDGGRGRLRCRAAPQGAARTSAAGRGSWTRSTRSGAATVDEQVELLEILWPSYFATREAAVAFPAVRLGQEASDGLWADLIERAAHPRRVAGRRSVCPSVSSAVARARCPRRSPWSRRRDRIPGAWCVLEPDAGHFTWVERPGCVVSALDRLSGPVAST